jgi:SnoaL-like domain
VFRRLRQEAALYYNGPYDFYALSRYDDVERGLIDQDTYTSSRGAVLDMIKAGVELPRGTLNFEDPPVHTARRGLLSRVFFPVIQIEGDRATAVNYGRVYLHADQGYEIWRVSVNSWEFRRAEGEWRVVGRQVHVIDGGSEALQLLGRALNGDGSAG